MEIKLKSCCEACVKRENCETKKEYGLIVECEKIERDGDLQTLQA